MNDDILASSRSGASRGVGSARHEGLYFIQNVPVVGNCVRWWRDGGHGYTVDIEDAGMFTEQQALGICRGRRPREDFAFPVVEIIPIARLHVDAQLLRELKSLPVEPAP